MQRKAENSMLLHHKRGGIHMKKENEKLEGIMKKVVKHMVNTELYGWPPQCASFLYQPIRPPRKNNDLLIDKRKLRK